MFRHHRTWTDEDEKELDGLREREQDLINHRHKMTELNRLKMKICLSEGRYLKAMLFHIRWLGLFGWFVYCAVLSLLLAIWNLVTSATRLAG